MRRTVDNITVVVVGFDNFLTKLEQYAAAERSDDHPIIEELLMEPVYAPYHTIIDGAPAEPIYIEQADTKAEEKVESAP